MSKIADIAVNLLVAVCTFIIMLVLGWTVRKMKSLLSRKKADVIVETEPLVN